MRNQLKNALTILAVIVSFTAFAQNGTIRGRVLDPTAEPVTFTTVALENTDYGAMTDLDGYFTLQAPAGEYTLLVQSYEYAEYKLKITLAAGETKALGDLILKKDDGVTTGDVVIILEKKSNTTAAVMEEKKNAEAVVDGASGEEMKEKGATSAAAAVKSVPGISIVGGKYVYVRGLGDRYTKTILNGLDIPGLDPDRNAIQLDIFPTNLIDKIMVSKSSAAHLPADFTGGIVDIALKEFPNQRSSAISVSLTYNPAMHFNSNYLSYEGGKLDWLGIADASYNNPITSGYVPLFENALTPGVERDRYLSVLSSFNPTMAAMKTNSLMDFGFSGNHGNQILVGKNGLTIGYNFALSYSNKTRYYDEVEYGRYGLDSETSVNDLQLRRLQTGSYGTNNVLASGLAGIAVKTSRTKITLNAIRLQNGNSKAGIFDYYSANQGSFYNAIQHNLEYSERSITNFILAGKHTFKDDNWSLVFKSSPTFSVLYDPDIRQTRYRYEDGDYNINTEAGQPVRIWREMNEFNWASKVDVEKKFTMKGENAKLRFGAAATYKQRAFEIKKYQFQVGNLELTGDPNELFLPENLWPIGVANQGNGTAYRPDFYPKNPNKYEANVIYGAGYASGTLFLTNKLKSVVGLRAEMYQQRYTGVNSQGLTTTNELVMDDLDFFPSLNLIYKLTEKQNLRLGYSMSVARPSFKELSYAEIIDPLSGLTFIGGLFSDFDPNNGDTIFYWDGNLVSTSIQNADIRWEVFQSRGQTVSASAFFKHFTNPIEMIQYTVSAGSYQPRNVGNAVVSGVELELRQGLMFIDSSLVPWAVTFNATYVESRVEMSETEKEGRINNARNGQTIGDFRDMAGQSPYLINAGLSYSSVDTSGVLSGLQFGLFYNVQGKTLNFVGVNDRPDVYTNPFHSLNLTASKAFGKDDNMKVSLMVTNLLDDDMELVYVSYQTEDQIFSRIKPGQSVKLGFSYKF